MRTGSLKNLKDSHQKKLQRYTDKQREILLAYFHGVSKTKRHLTRADMQDLGFSRDKIRGSFTSLTELQKEFEELFPEVVEGFTEAQIQSSEKKNQLSKDIKKFKRFVVTTAISGASKHEGFYESIKSYCKEMDALLLLLPAELELNGIDPDLAIEQWVLQDLDLNSNIKLSSIKINPKSAQPLTSLHRIGQRSGSMIVASPKQSLEFVAIGNEKFPHAVMSTGAITRPMYISPKGERRNDYIAKHDHVIGAVIVEVVNNKEYHFRQIQADHRGHFFDLGVKFTGAKKKKNRPVALILGDLHCGEEDPLALNASFEMAVESETDTIVFHDVFGGISVNHHEDDNNIQRAKLAKEGKLDIYKELKNLGKRIDQFTSLKHIKRIIIPDANHHDFLSIHYLSKGKYLKDPHNFRLAHELVLAMLDGHDPIQYALEKLIGLKHPEKIHWLKPDEDCIIAGVQVGAHGHRGANGSKGSKRTIENAYLKAIHGHTHSPYIFRGVFCVGTITFLRQGFNKGPSGWAQANCFLYETGMRQLINIIKGKWRMK